MDQIAFATSVDGETYYSFQHVSRALFGNVLWRRSLVVDHAHLDVVTAVAEGATKKLAVISLPGIRQLAAAYDCASKAEDLIKELASAQPTAAQNQVALLQEKAADVLEAFYKEKGNAALRTAMSGG